VLLSVPLTLYCIDKMIQTRRAYRTVKVLTAVNLPYGNSNSAGITHLKLRCDGIHYNAGDYTFVQVPEISRIDWHPFSISSAPGQSGKDELTLHVMNMGKNQFTEKLNKLIPRLADGSAEIRLDGGYGALSIDLDQYKVVICVAGGVGVTPMMAIWADLSTRYGSQLPKLQAAHLVWTCQTAAPFDSWFNDPIAKVKTTPHADRFGAHFFSTDRAAAPKKEEGKDANDIQLKVMNSGGASTASSGGPVKVNKGRPNYNALFKQFQEEANKLGGTVLPEEIAILCCGPVPMITDAIRTAKSLGLHVHKETFFL